MTSNTPLEVGQKAPNFTLPVSDTETITLDGLKGKKVVLYFYPKDSTPGCTKQACGFTENLPNFEAVDATIIGVSKDSLKSHDKFTAKYDLNITLGSDENGTVCEDYGVWVEKNMYGRKYMGIQRATFLIDGNAMIQKIWPKVKVKDHVAEVLEAVKAL